MICTASDSYGLFDCNHCLIEALQRCRERNKAAYSKWGQQLKRENPERYERIKAQLEGSKNE